MNPGFAAAFCLIVGLTIAWAPPAHAACGIGYTEVLDRRGEPVCVSAAAARAQKLATEHATRDEALRLRQEIERMRQFLPQQREAMRQRAYRDELLRRQRDRTLQQRAP